MRHLKTQTNTLRNCFSTRLLLWLIASLIPCLAIPTATQDHHYQSIPAGPPAAGCIVCSMPLACHTTHCSPDQHPGFHAQQFVNQTAQVHPKVAQPYHHRRSLRNPGCSCVSDLLGLPPALTHSHIHCQGHTQEAPVCGRHAAAHQLLNHLPLPGCHLWVGVRERVTQGNITERFGSKGQACHGIACSAAVVSAVDYS
jgi:hypothetical protein